MVPTRVARGRLFEIGGEVDLFDDRLYLQLAAYQINARNLFDEVYAESGFLARTGHFPGEPRNLRLEIYADFFRRGEPGQRLDGPGR